MAKLRKVLDFFVTIESDEDEKAPEKAASPDPNEAAAAARQFVEDGHEDFGERPQGKQVRDVRRQSTNTTLGDEFGSDDYDLSDLEAELAGDYSARAEAGLEEPGRGDGIKRVSLEDFDGALSIKEIDTIYSEAGLPARDAQDFTIYTLMTLLSSEHLQGLPAATKRASLMVAMQARNVEVGDVIADAIHRDHALDMYDMELTDQLTAIEEETVLKNEELQEKLQRLIEEIRAEIEENNRTLDGAREAYQSWRLAKQEEEQQLFDAVDPFVAPGANEISVDN